MAAACVVTWTSVTDAGQVDGSLARGARAKGASLMPGSVSNSNSAHQRWFSGLSTGTTEAPTEEWNGAQRAGESSNWTNRTGLRVRKVSGRSNERIISEEHDANIDLLDLLW
eukprot:7746200-Pyramimonas_sp.AAC.2